MGILQRRRIVSPAFGLTLVLATLAGLFVQPVVAQSTPARIWRQIPVTDLAFGAPRSIMIDNAGNAWIGGLGGATILRANGDKMLIALSLSNAVVTAIAQDHADVIWLATDVGFEPGLGVQAIQPGGQRVIYTIADGLADNHVRDLAVSETGDLWFATAGGLSRRAPDGTWGRFTQAQGLVHDDLYALAMDAAGALWIGSRAGVSRLSPAGEWRTYTVEDGLADAWIHDIAVDRLGNVWCATDAGASIRAGNDVWRTAHTADGLPSAAINALAADATGGVWIATDAGLAYWSITGEWMFFNADQPNNLIDNPILAIAIDAQSRPWFVGPAGVSILLEGGPASGRPVIPTRPRPAPPTPTSVSAAIKRNAPTGLPALTMPTLVSVPTTASSIELGPLVISRTLFFIIFFTIFALSILGAIILLVRIITHAGRASPRQVAPARGEALAVAPLEGPPPRPEEVLLPARLNGDDSLPPEVAAALEELDRYMPRATPPAVLLHPELLSPTPADEIPGAPLIQEAPALRDEAITIPDAAQPAPVSGLTEWDGDALLQPAEPPNLSALLEEGKALARAGRKAAAYDVFSIVTRLAPNHVEAWIWKGGTALHPQEAVRCLKKAVELDPDNTQARAGLSWALSQLAAAEASPDEEA